MAASATTDRRTWQDVGELALQAQEGDREVFGLLVEEFSPMVRSIVLRRCGRKVDIDELTQEIFLRALSQLHQLRDPTRFAAWLKLIASRMAINHATREKAMPAADPIKMAMVLGSSREIVDDLIVMDQAERVDAAIAELRPVDREIIELFYVRGRSLKEIMAVLDIPRGTVKRRLCMARSRLRERLMFRLMDGPGEYVLA